MSEEIKEKDDGGLMYQQLRKFISVIVSFYLNCYRILLILFYFQLINSVNLI